MKNGFSLVELMITVGIIGILSLLATPLYKDYVIRVKVLKAINETSFFKQKILDFYYDNPVISNTSAESELLQNMSNFNTDEVITVHLIANRTGSPTATSRYEHGYIIQLDKEKIGFPPNPDPASQYMLIYVLITFKLDYPVGIVSSDGVNHTIAANEEIVKPFCGNIGFSGSNIADPNYVPRKYLPHGCRDYIGVSGGGNLSEIIEDGAM